MPETKFQTLKASEALERIEQAAESAGLEIHSVGDLIGVQAMDRKTPGFRVQVGLFVPAEPEPSNS
jgi:hypothetical protein